MSRVDVNTRVSDLVRFIKERTVSNIVEATTSGEVRLEDDDLRKVVSIVENSSSQNFLLAYPQVESAITELVDGLKK
jgi:hypothetical protein